MQTSENLKLNVTDAAAEQFVEIFNTLEEKPAGVRIYSNHGCCGTSVQMELAEESKAEELQISVKGVEFFIDAEFFEHINRATIDFVEGGFRLIGFNKHMGCYGMKVLILCTANSCRSQMAHGFLQALDNRLVVCSAGKQASGLLNEKAVTVMAEAGVPIGHHTSDQVDKYLSEDWDFVITVCGGANETCPAFHGTVNTRLHFGFDDPSHIVGSEDFVMMNFRMVRDEIQKKMLDFYNHYIASRQNSQP